jgi:uncharacterized damage-inducible protein DinB
MSTASSAPYIEPWLRGTHTEVPAVARAVIHALELALDDLQKWTAGLTDLEIHAHPFGCMSVASQLKHIARSVDRLLTYAEGGQISDQQLRLLEAEPKGAEVLAELLAEVQTSFNLAADRIRTLGNADPEIPRSVGRKQMPTTIGGALVHVAEHTQRHVGQVVITAKVLRGVRGAGGA